MVRTEAATLSRRPRLESSLTLRSIVKSFGAVHALRGVDLEVRRGEITALLGDNGAGKSTLVKILSGVHTADAGTIAFDGVPVTLSSPTEARQHGIATVYQDLALCNNLDVVANLFLGHEHGGLLLGEEQMEARSTELLAQLQATLPSLRAKVAGLSGGQRQTVAIARALVGDPRVIILDEPTAALGVEQTSQVLNLVERLRDTGHAVLLITHNMSDVKAVADKAVVLRLGQNNGVFDVARTTPEQIVAAITGATDNAVTRRAGRAGRQREEANDE